jgi:hypothetical protein
MRRQHTAARSMRLYSKPVKIDIHRSGELVIRVDGEPTDEGTLLLLSVDTIEQAETLRLRTCTLDPVDQRTYRLNLQLRQGKERLDLEDIEPLGWKLLTLLEKPRMRDIDATRVGVDDRQLQRTGRR